MLITVLIVASYSGQPGGAKGYSAYWLAAMPCLQKSPGIIIASIFTPESDS